MKRRKLLGMLLAATVAAFTLVGCGSTSSGEEKDQQGASGEEPGASEEEQTPDEGETEEPEGSADVELPEMETPDEWVSRFEGVTPTPYTDFSATDDQIDRKSVV